MYFHQFVPENENREYYLYLYYENLGHLEIIKSKYFKYDLLLCQFSSFQTI